MPLRRCIAALVTFAALAAPSAALAQSAGDDQYQDPFGGSSGSSGGSGGGSGSSGGSSSSGGSPTPATPAPAPSTSSSAAPAATTAQATVATSRSQLPYTGAPVEAALLAAAGGVLLAGGVTLRVRLRERDAA